MSRGLVEELSPGEPPFVASLNDGMKSMLPQYPTPSGLITGVEHLRAGLAHAHPCLVDWLTPLYPLMRLTSHDLEFAPQSCLEWDATA